MGLKFNLKKERGSIKGDIGEVLVKNKLLYLHRTRELSPTWLETRIYKIPQKIKEFLLKHWYTIDLFKFINENNVVKTLELYEVKVRGYYNKRWEDSNRWKFYKSTISTNALKAYKEAQEIGFNVKIAEVRLYDDWECEILYYDFKPEEFYISDGNSKYSKKRHDSVASRFK